MRFKLVSLSVYLCVCDEGNQPVTEKFSDAKSFIIIITIIIVIRARARSFSSRPLPAILYPFVCFKSSVCVCVSVLSFLDIVMLCECCARVVYTPESTHQNT